MVRIPCAAAAAASGVLVSAKTVFRDSSTSGSWSVRTTDSWSGPPSGPGTTKVVPTRNSTIPGLIVAWLMTTWSPCAEMRTTGGPDAALAGARLSPAMTTASAAALAMIRFFM